MGDFKNEFSGCWYGGRGIVSLYILLSTSFHLVTIEQWSGAQHAITVKASWQIQIIYLITEFLKFPVCLPHSVFLFCAEKPTSKATVILTKVWQLFTLKFLFPCVLINLLRYVLFVVFKMSAFYRCQMLTYLKKIISSSRIYCSVKVSCTFTV